MKNMLKRLERLFAAIGLAEEGGGDAAREVLMERNDTTIIRGKIELRQRTPVAGAVRPARRAA